MGGPSTWTTHFGWEHEVGVLFFSVQLCGTLYEHFVGCKYALSTLLTTIDEKRVHLMQHIWVNHFGYEYRYGWN